MPRINDEEILSVSKEHVFWTWSAQTKVDPIPVKTAKGVYFWDIKGKKYLDFNSMTMCVNIGHGNERVIQAIKDQLDAIPYVAPGLTTEIRARASKMISELTPNQALTKILFTLGGADANENAIKIARKYTGRHKILTRYRSYHGATAGAMALTGDPRRVGWEPTVMSGVVHFLDPYRYRSTFHRSNPEVSEEQFTRDYLAHLEEVIQYEGPESIAAILMETVTGTNGVIIPPDGYMQGVREICDRYGFVMISDEVMAGFGRTGKWFAIEHWGVVPDIITMAKGLTSAYAPLGAVAIKPEIAAVFNEHAFESGLTYTSHPVSLAAAVANIEVMWDDKLLENSQKMGEKLKSLLSDLKANHPSVGDARSIGLFGIIELVKNRETREPITPWNTTNSVMRSLKKHFSENGLFIYTHWHTILIIPPLIITEAQLEDGMKIISDGLFNVDKEVVK
ncbi:MAG TPA: aminotransferase class III-fold pyridoxal phosphate-dependent enzyme [Anaerolineales bacterium]|nr:aminotransferase class III-fold pyridoxal phosphate-dependent enzyme [Anaerolineales bacterium]